MQVMLRSISLAWVLSTAVVAQETLQIQAVDVSRSALLALKNHPKIQLSQADIALSHQQLSKIESGFLPTLSLNLGIGREDSNNTSSRALNGSGSVEMERRESGVTLSQMLFDGFNTDNLRRGQLEQISAQEMYYQNVASEVALKAIEVHLNVVTKDLLLGDHLANLKVHEQIAKDVGLRVRSGKDDRARVSQISARLSLALANLETAKSQVLSAHADYAREVGSPPGSNLLAQKQIMALSSTEKEFVEGVLANNVFLQAKLKELKGHRFQEQAADNTLMPHLFLESGATWNDNIDGVRGRNSDAFVMLRMQYDLYDGGASRADQRIAKYRTQSVRYELDDLRRDLQREATQSWANYQANLKRVNFLQDYAEASQTTKNAYAQQFNIGQRSLIDLLDAENELLRAKGQLHESRQALYMSQFQMLHLQGGLLASLKVEKHLPENDVVAIYE